MSVPALSDPGRTCLGRYRAFDVAFRHSNGVGSRTETDFGAQSHGPPTRCPRFAGGIAPPPRKTRFRMAGQSFRAGLATRWVPRKGFRSFPPPLPSFTCRTVSVSSTGGTNR